MPDNEIYTNLPEWNEPGTEPTQQKKDNGWQPGERPPAPWLNWWMHRVYRSLLQIRDAFVGHRDATSGVHGIPEGEDIATEGYVDDEIEPVAQGLSEHVDDTDNPHGVTKAQVGLSNVDNVKQAPKSEFDAHVGKALGQADSHPTPERRTWGCNRRRSTTTLAAAPHSGMRPSGAQTKAEAAAGRCRAELDAHKTENASTSQKGHAQLPPQSSTSMFSSNRKCCQNSK